MLTCEDAPKTLRLQQEREARLRVLGAEHMVPLTALVRQIRADIGTSDGVPYFDPCDGGTKARALFLLEAPGPKASLSGFVSRNNPDETAKNSFDLHREAGLPRQEVVLWNIVPWYVGSGQKIWPVEQSDIDQAAPYLDHLIKLLPRVEAVVLVGRKAQAAYSQLKAAPARLFMSPHPSPVAIRTRPNTRQQILRVWREVADLLGCSKGNAL